MVKQIIRYASFCWPKPSFWTVCS